MVAAAVPWPLPPPYGPKHRPDCSPQPTIVQQDRTNGFGVPRTDLKHCSQSNR